MLTAIISGDKNNSQQKQDAKETYFGQRWNAISALHRRITGRDAFFSKEDQCSPTIQLSEQIIKSFGKKLPEGLVEFLNRVQEESLNFVAEEQGIRFSEAERAAAFNESGARLLRRIYDALDVCAGQLNSILAFNGLHMVGTGPKHVCEITKFSRTRQPLETVTYYRARVGTPTWSLVLRAKEDTIECFLLPVGKVMGLSRVENTYQPAAVLRAQLDEEGAVEWEIDNKPLTSEREQELCMVLLRNLIETTKETLRACRSKQRQAG